MTLKGGPKFAVEESNLHTDDTYYEAHKNLTLSVCLIT